MQDSPVIETRTLTKHYGSFAAVNGLDLTVPRGCAFGLLGPNGAGKSTTIQMLLGLVQPTSGSASVLGQDVSHKPHLLRARVASAATGWSGTCKSEMSRPPLQTPRPPLCNSFRPRTPRGNDNRPRKESTHGRTKLQLPKLRP